MVISSTKHKIPTRVYSPFTFVLSENVFLSRCDCSVRSSLCFTFSWMLHVYKSDVRVAVFETRWPPKHWLRSIENRIVWTCIFEAAGSKAEGNISHNYRFHIVTRFKGWFPYDRRRSRIADRRSQKVLRSSAIIWKHTSEIVCDRLRSIAIFCDHMETKVLRSAIETYPIIFWIPTHDSTLLCKKATAYLL